MENRKSRVNVRPITKAEEVRWVALLKEHHYLGFNGVIGERINYVAEEDGQWIALLSWAAAALKLESRDNWIGWCREQKMDRLKFVANNWRFLILPKFRRKNLASHVLSLNLKRLSNDWKTKYSHPILMVETFVDLNRNKGTCYKADNWVQVGLTKGFRKFFDTYDFHGEKKIIFMKPLALNARETLGLSWTNSVLIPSYQRSKCVIDALNVPVFGPKGLLAFCNTVKDARSKHGKRYQTGPLLSFCLLAIFSGMNSYSKICLWGQSLTTKQLADLRVWRAPSVSAIRSFILSLNANEVDKKITDWFLGSDSLRGLALAIDGKTLRGSRDGDKRALQLLSLVTHDDGVVVTQEKVDDKTNEIPVAQELLKGLDIKGSIITADAMHTQIETATVIVREKEADYVFTVKGNQPNLKTDIEKALQKSAFSP